MTAGSGIALQGTPASEWRQGWTVVLAAGFGIGLSAFPTYTLGLFIQPLTRSFGWSISAIVFAQTLCSLAMAVFSPFAGQAMDRFGARPLVLNGGLTLCVLFGLLAFNGGSLWAFYGLWLLMGIAIAITSPMIWLKALVDRFEAHRGLASSIALCGSSLAGAIAPLLAAVLIARAGWETAYLGLAAYMLLSALPLAFLFFHDRRALQSRAVFSASGPTADSPLRTQSGLSIGDAFRTREFWILVTSFFFAGAGIVAFLVHIAPLLISKNFSAMSAASAMTAFSISAILGRVTTGLLMDRLFAPWLAGVALLLPVGAAFLLLEDASYPLAIAAAILTGLAAGAEYTMLSYLTVGYFGMRRYGTISACLNAVFTLGCMAGPLIAAWRLTVTGSYDQTVMLLGGSFLVASILMFLCRRSAMLDR